MTIKKPKPFIRPSVSISSDHDDVQREWMTVEPHRLGQGDIVADRGKVEAVDVEFWTDASALGWSATVLTKVRYLSGHVEQTRGTLTRDDAYRSVRDLRYEGPKVFAFTAGIQPGPLRG